MRFAIVGAGAIGAYVGAALARGGADVTLIARGEHLAAMQARGVRVLSPRGDFEAHPAATDDIGAVADAEVVFVGLKAYSLPELAPRIGAALRPGAAVIAAQNGIPWWYFQSEGGPFDGSTVESVDPGGVVSAAIPPASVVGCVVYCATEIVEPGVIRHIEGTRFSIGEPDGSESERCAAISEAFRAGGLKCPVDAQLRDQIWLKLIGNAAFNPVSRRSPGRRSASWASSRRCASCCGRCSRRAPRSRRRSASRSRSRSTAVSRRASRSATTRRRCSRTSRPARRSRLDCMTGAIAELADRVGVEVPRIRAVDAVVRLAEVLSLRRASQRPAA